MSQFPSSSCLVFTFATGTWTALCPGPVPAHLPSQQDPRAVSLVVEKAVQSVCPQCCPITSLCRGLHCHNLNSSSSTLTVKVSDSNSVGSEPKGDMFGGNPGFTEEQKNNPRLYWLNSHGQCSTMELNGVYGIMNGFNHKEGIKCMLKTAEGS